MIRRVKKNNEVIFSLSMNLEIDLDALNLVAFTEDNSLCKCRYFSIGKEQNLIYSIKDLKSIKECRLNYEKVCILLQAIVELIDFLKQQNMYLRNIRVRTTDIYMLDSQFKFVYLPLQQKEDIPPEAFIIKFLHIVHCADREVIHLKKQLKGFETFELMKDYINTIGIKEKMEISMEECICETEAETSLLNADEDVVLEDEGETTVLSQHITDFLPNEFSECETTVLSDAAMPDDGEIITKEGAYDLYLLRISSGERIHINKPIYSIGKDVNQMDYVLGNASVSRNHATIYLQGERYFLVDNGSTNGSALEGVRIKEGEKVELEDGYIVSLGNEVFQVLLERKES